MRRQTEGEGNGKKVSKKKAAETMLHELRQLPPLSPVIVTEAAGAGAVVADTATASDPAATAAAVAAAAAKAKAAKRKQPSVKKKARNLIKVDGVEPEEVNPISRLIMVAQAHKAKDPVYELVAEAGTPRRREFVIEVLAVHRKARGMGSTKKKARRQAAESECEWWGLVGAFFKTYFLPSRSRRSPSIIVEYCQQYRQYDGRGGAQLVRAKRSRCGCGGAAAAAVDAQCQRSDNGATHPAAHQSVQARPL